MHFAERLNTCGAINSYTGMLARSVVVEALRVFTAYLLPDYCLRGTYYCRGPSAVGKHIHMYTYGAPRVGNKAFADAFNQRLKGDAWRITNKADIVPRCVGLGLMALGVLAGMRDGAVYILYHCGTVVCACSAMLLPGTSPTRQTACPGVCWFADKRQHPVSVYPVGYSRSAVAKC
jgi:hypothetical protein